MWVLSKKKKKKLNTVALIIPYIYIRMGEQRILCINLWFTVSFHEFELIFVKLWIIYCFAFSC